MAPKKKPGFEAQLAALEALIDDMESGGQSLEESRKRYEEGMKLRDSLEKELEAAKQRLTVLRQGENGEDVETLLEDM